MDKENCIETKHGINLQSLDDGVSTVQLSISNLDHLQCLACNNDTFQNKQALSLNINAFSHAPEAGIFGEDKHEVDLIFFEDVGSISMEKK
jgi:hypothetical protein